MKNLLSKLTHSLRSKIILLTCGMVFLTALAMRQLLRGTHNTPLDADILTAVLVLVTSLLTYLVTRRLTNPLESITRSLRESEDYTWHPGPFAELKDEIGDLARAFQKMTAELIKSKERYDVAVRGSNNGLWDWDVITGESYCSPRFREILGDDEFVPSAEAFDERIHPDDLDRVVRSVEKHLSQKRPYDTEFRMRHADGHYVWVRGRGQAIWDQRGQPVRMAGSMEDITVRKANEDERRKMEEEREHLIEKLARSNEELDNFAYIASHDLKEPLRAIHNHCRFLLEDHEDALDDDGLRRVHRLMELSQRMERLTSDLLYFSRLGRDRMAFKETDLNDVIDDITCTLQDTLKEKNAVIVVPAPLPAIACDTVRVTEMLRNLVGNAIKYNDNSEKRVEIGYENSTRKVFYVKDNGIGIDEEYHDSVFRIFKRLHGRKKYGDGTGSGLTFVKKIVEQHGGKIWLQSKKGEGTTFFFTLEAGAGA